MDTVRTNLSRSSQRYVPNTESGSGHASNLASRRVENLESTAPKTSASDKKKFVETLISWRDSQENKQEANQICHLIKLCCVKNETELFLFDFYSITELPPLPPHLTTLKVSRFMALKELSSLPTQLTTLSVSRCPVFQKLPDHLLPNLVSLEVSLCDALKELPTHLWPVLVNLTVTKCETLVKIPNNLPDTLEKLNLIECDKLAELHIAPQLIELDISWCCNLKTLPQLPSTLTTLNIEGCRALVKFSNLPEGLMKFYAANCSALTEFPEKFPPKLTSLNLLGCSSLHQLPEPLPPGLTHLNLTRCCALKALPSSLPLGLTIKLKGTCLELPKDTVLNQIINKNTQSTQHLSEFSIIDPVGFSFNTQLPRVIQITAENVNEVIKLLEQKINKSWKPVRNHKLIWNHYFNNYGDKLLSFEPGLKDYQIFCKLEEGDRISDLPTKSISQEWDVIFHSDLKKKTNCNGGISWSLPGEIKAGKAISKNKKSLSQPTSINVTWDWQTVSNPNRDNSSSASRYPSGLGKEFLYFTITAKNLSKTNLLFYTRIPYSFAQKDTDSKSVKGALRPQVNLEKGDQIFIGDKVVLIIKEKSEVGK